MSIPLTRASTNVSSILSAASYIALAECFVSHLPGDSFPDRPQDFEMLPQNKHAGGNIPEVQDGEIVISDLSVYCLDSSLVGDCDELRMAVKLL